MTAVTIDERTNVRGGEKMKLERIRADIIQCNSARDSGCTITDSVTADQLQAALEAFERANSECSDISRQDTADPE